MALENGENMIIMVIVFILKIQEALNIGINMISMVIR